jgi:hypothetical protein
LTLTKFAELPTKTAVNNRTRDFIAGSLETSVTYHYNFAFRERHLFRYSAQREFELLTAGFSHHFDQHLMGIFGIGQLSIERNPNLLGFACDGSSDFHALGVDRDHRGRFSPSQISIDLGIDQDGGGVIVVHVLANAIADFWGDGIGHGSKGS